MRCVIPLFVLGLSGSVMAQAPAAGEHALDRARTELRAAEAEAARLAKAAEAARGTAQRLAADRRTAAADLEAAEARLSAAAIDLRLRDAEVARAQAALRRDQRPVAELVASLINLDRRPPLLTLAADGSVEDMVRVRALLDTAIPEIQRRSAATARRYRAARALAEEARVARGRLADARRSLEAKQAHFAKLEQDAIARSASLGGAAVGAGDELIVAGEGLALAQREQANSARAAALGSALGRLDPAPARPGRAVPLPPEIGYRLPLEAPVILGLGSVGPDGIQARGITLRAGRGARLVAPAPGTLRFAAPFRRHDGVLIIDHGGGWMTMLVGARATVPVGTRLSAGDPLGVALGDVVIELSKDGTFVSAATMAQRSRSLSIQPRRG